MAEQQGPPAGVVDGQDLRQHVELTPQQATERLAEIAAKRNAPQPSRLAELKSDQDWVKRFLNGGAREKREFSDAVAAAGGEQQQQYAGIGETVNSLDDPNKQSSRAYETLVGALRDRGLPESAESYLRAMDNGETVVRPSEGDGIAARRARERLNNDPEFRKAALSGEVGATNLLGALNRCIAWSVADGRPLSDEIRSFLQARGLM
jgi:hypothetical protein